MRIGPYLTPAPTRKSHVETFLILISLSLFNVSIVTHSKILEYSL